MSDERRGYYTGWLQTSPTLGIVLSLIVIIATRTYFGEDAFNAWAWRIPFLFSFLLVFIAIYMRANFEESPIFEEIKAKGQTTKNPWREAFLNPANIKYVLIATIVVLGQGVVWYSGQFWALYFLQQVSKVDALTTAYIVGAGLVIGTPTLIFFGWLSDNIGRKPVILGGMLACGGHLLSAVYVARIGHAAGQYQHPIAILIIAILVCYVGMVYGPIGAFLAEFFPGRIRYTSVSVPYQIGNGWGGGLVPFITTAAYHGDGQSRLCADLPDRCSGGVLRAQPVPDAGDAQDENLGAGGGIGEIGNLQDKSGAGPFGPGTSLMHRYRTVHEAQKTFKGIDMLDQTANDRSSGLWEIFRPNVS